MSARTGINVDIIQTKSLFFRNLLDNAPISSKNILYADGSGGTYWSSLYIENIPGFSSFYASRRTLLTVGVLVYYTSKDIAMSSVMRSDVGRTRRCRSIY